MNKNDPKFVKYIVRQMREIQDGRIKRDNDEPRWEFEEGCKDVIPLLPATVLESFVAAIYRSYRDEFGFKGFDYVHLPGILDVERRIASQIDMLLLANGDTEEGDHDILWMSINDVVLCMINWIKRDETIQSWHKNKLLDCSTLPHNACDHLMDYKFNFNSMLEGTYKEILAVRNAQEEQEQEPAASESGEYRAAESGQHGAI